MYLSLHKVWNRDDSITGFSDSDGFVCNDKYVKHYIDLPLDVVQAYHQIQNSFSSYSKCYDESGIFNWRYFSSICLKILDLENEIDRVHSSEHNKTVIQSCVPYVEWKSLIGHDLDTFISLKNYDFNSYLFSLLKKDLTNDWLTHNYSFNGRQTSSLSLLYNAIFKPVQDNCLDIVITDLATSIQASVDYYRNNTTILI